MSIRRSFTLAGWAMAQAIFAKVSSVWDSSKGKGSSSGHGLQGFSFAFFIALTGVFIFIDYRR